MTARREQLGKINLIRHGRNKGDNKTLNILAERMNAGECFE
jgi:hypothetical protein